MNSLLRHARGECLCRWPRAQWDLHPRAAVAKSLLTRGFQMPAIDTERFRLRNFVEKLVASGDCEVYEKPIDLIDVGAVLDGNPMAVLFKAAGPEKAELVGNVMASRKRLARALDTDERGLLATLNQRLNRLHPPAKV